MPGYDFYIAFNFFRLAAIFHGIKGRVIRGTAASAQARERVAVLPELAALPGRRPSGACEAAANHLGSFPLKPTIWQRAKQLKVMTGKREFARQQILFAPHLGVHDHVQAVAKHSWRLDRPVLIQGLTLRPALCRIELVQVANVILWNDLQV